MRVPFRRLVVFFAITGVVVSLYTIKQMSLFDLSSTSSFTGLNLCQSIGIPGVGEKEHTAPVQEPSSDKPRVLSRVRKANGAINFNNEYYLTLNHEFEQEYRSQVLQSSPLFLAKSYLTNLEIYLLPSSQYTPNIIVDRLPQRSAYDYVFSFPVLPVLLTMAFLFWLARTNKSSLPGAIGLFLPVAFIVFFCIAFDRGENMRFKFFIEPVLFVFLAAQAYAAGTPTIRKVLTKASRLRMNSKLRTKHFSIKGIDRMRNYNKPLVFENVTEQQDLPAGDFSSWLCHTRRALLVEDGTDVDCGECAVERFS